MVDVVVIGAGIVGAACARTLSQLGRSVLVLERSASAGGASSQGEGNILVSDKAPGEELRLAQYARSLWPQVAAELSSELGPGFPSLDYDAKGGLVVATTEAGAAPLLAFAANQRDAGVDARPVSLAEALDLEPDLNSDAGPPSTTRKTRRSNRSSPQKRCSPRPGCTEPRSARSPR